MYIHYVKKINPIIVLSFLLLSLCSFGENKNDSLLNIYHSQNQLDSNKIKALHTFVQLNFSSPDTAIKYAKKSIELSKSIENALLLAKSYNELAISYYYKGDLIKSKANLNLSLSFYTRIYNKSGMATCYNGIGVIYYDQGKLYKALQLYIQSLRIKEKLKDTMSVAMTLNNIGNVYKDLNNFDKSLEYYNKSLKLKEKISDRNGQAMTYNNIGLLYHNNKKYIKALDFYSKSLTIKKEINDIHGEAMTLNNIGLTYENQKNFKKALVYYEKSIVLRKKIGDQYGLAMSLINIGSIYSKTGNFSICYKKLLESEKIAIKIGATSQLRDCYQRFYEAYELQGNSKKALSYYKSYIAIKDSLMSEENVKDLQRLQAKFENKNKRLAIQDLSRKEELNKVQLAKNKIDIESKTLINMGLIMGLILSVGFIIFFFINNKNRRKRNEVLRKSLKEKEILFKEVHHRVKNNFQVISSLLNLQANNNDNELVKLALHKAKDRVSSMALVHEKLYLSDDLSKINMADYTKQLVEYLIDNIDDRKEIQAIIKIDDIFLDVEKAIPLGLIFNELITNSMKYAFPKNLNNIIEIGIKKQAERIEVYYKDNGVGLAKDFNLDNLDSLGLNLVQILVIQIHGELKITNENGTLFSFHFK